MAPDHCEADGASSPLSSVPSTSSDSDLSELSSTPSPPSSPVFASRPLSLASSSQTSPTKSLATPADMRPTPPSSDNDAERPHKRRKIADPQERTTDRVDLRSPDVAKDPNLQRVLDVLHKKRKIVVIVGAGISVSAGIPDFRSKSGLFNTLKAQHKLKSSGKDLFDASVYGDNTSTAAFHDMVRDMSESTRAAEPTPFHHLLATLAQEGRLLRLYSQNVDGIDTSLPPLKSQVPLPKKAPWPKTVQLHGGLDYMVCSKCSTISNLKADMFNGPTPPPCEECVNNDLARQVAERRSHGVGCLRPRMVLYNEHNPDDEAIGSCAKADLRTRPDAVIVAGTTLKVPGVQTIVREMCKATHDRRNGVTIWMNNDPEPVEKKLANIWDIVVRGPCDAIAEYAAMPRWNDPIEYKDVTEDDLKAKQKPVVLVQSQTPKKPSAVEQIQGQMLTPAQSPRIKAQPSIDQEPPTPSKSNGRKRKSGTQTTLVKKEVKAPAKRQPKKKAAPKSKTKVESAKITSAFSVSKSSTAKQTVKSTKGSDSFVPFDPKKENRNIVTPSEKMKQEDALDLPTLGSISATSTTIGRLMGSLTHLKELLPTNFRTNAASVREVPDSPEMEPFTSRPGTPTHDDERPVALHIEPAIPESDSESRPSSARSDTIVPRNAPRGFADMIAWT